jgi:hypothetical protein
MMEALRSSEREFSEGHMAQHSRRRHSFLNIAGVANRVTSGGQVTRIRQRGENVSQKAPGKQPLGRPIWRWDIEDRLHIPHRAVKGQECPLRQYFVNTESRA